MSSDRAALPKASQGTVRVAPELVDGELEEPGRQVLVEDGEHPGDRGCVHMRGHQVDDSVGMSAAALTTSSSLRPP